MSKHKKSTTLTSNLGCKVHNFQSLLKTNFFVFTVLFYPAIFLFNINITKTTELFTISEMMATHAKFRAVFPWVTLPTADKRTFCALWWSSTGMFQMLRASSPSPLSFHRAVLARSPWRLTGLDLVQNLPLLLPIAAWKQVEHGYVDQDNNIAAVAIIIFNNLLHCVYIYSVIF